MELIPTIPLHLGPAKIGQEKPTDVLFPGLGNILNIVWKVGFSVEIIRTSTLQIILLFLVPQVVSLRIKPVYEMEYIYIS